MTASNTGKKKKGRPHKQKHFTVQELKAQSAEYRRRAAERRVDYQNINVEEFVDEVDSLSRKKKANRARDHRHTNEGRPFV